MTPVALIPAKDFTDSKTRLAPVLDGQARASLSRWMLRRAIRAAKGAAEVGAVRLVGAEASTKLRELARSEGIEYAPERVPTLNGALQAELDALRSRGRAVLIVFSDLPLIEPSDLDAMIASARKAQASLALAPDARGLGTNALLYRDRGRRPLRLVYGPASFPRYLAQAGRFRLRTHVFRNEGLACDLDTPSDWKRLKSTVIKLGFTPEVRTP